VPKKYPLELQERASRLALESSKTMPLRTACRRVGEQLGIPTETIRNWVQRQQTDAGERPGLTTSDRDRISELERENRELRRANAILRSASAFFAAELDRPSR
jgi:transposase